MALNQYRKKRDFEKTPEPVSGKPSKGKLRFVVQRHDASHLHYDFRLEMEGVLKSWAVPKGPSMKAGERRLAVMVEDHPLDYGKFYGIIPEGNYGAGTVEIWDEGTYLPLEELPAAEREAELLRGLEQGDLKFSLKGKHLNGAFALVRMNDGTGKNWLLIKKKDEYAQKSYAIAKVPSLKIPAGSAGTKKKTEKKSKPVTAALKKKTAQADKMPAEPLKPMLATLAEVFPADGNWLYEPKYDGYRAITRIQEGKVQMDSRNGNSFVRKYAALVKELRAVKDEVVLDGEVVIEDKKGVSNFQMLQNFDTTREGTLTYYVFDILYLNGHSLMDMPLVQRKELLSAFFKENDFENIKESAFVQGGGEALFKKLTAKGYEGIIAKDAEGSYREGRRSEGWLKIKSAHTQEAVICGYTQPQNSRKYFGSLVLGMYENGKLRYVGNCGTGFTETSLKDLYEQMQELQVKKCPFPEKPVLRGRKSDPTWIRPELVCNVKFQHWTRESLMRVPVFQGLRTDKEAAGVVREIPKEARPAVQKTGEQVLMLDGHEVKCTHLDKIYWPAEKISKGDLIDYYLQIAPYILPYLKDRPLSLNRFPNGIEKPGFYQKDMDTEQVPSWLHTEKIWSKSNDDYIDYLICNDTATLIYMVNLGCIDINPWNSTFREPDRPDFLIMDLDPDGVPFERVVDTALAVKEVCDALDIPCFCKTSGATGLHVYIPLDAAYTYDEVKTFGELMAAMTHERVPAFTSLERMRAKRRRKVYIDFLQNRKGQTIAAPYSVRPKPGATVSTPLRWTELTHKLRPAMFTIFNIGERLHKTGDLWKDVLGKGIDLKKVLRRIDKLT
ncbi:MAG: DNA ligase D [Flavobacteriales bacterium]